MYRRPTKQERLVRSTGTTSTFGSFNNMAVENPPFGIYLPTMMGIFVDIPLPKIPSPQKVDFPKVFMRIPRYWTTFDIQASCWLLNCDDRRDTQKAMSQTNIMEMKLSIPSSAPHQKGARDYWQPLFLLGGGILTNPIEKRTEIIDILSSSEVDLRLQRLTFSYAPKTKRRQQSSS